MGDRTQNWKGLEFVSAVPSQMREAVEFLFFFNPGQALRLGGIRASIGHSGPPEILQRDGKLWIGVPSGAMQCLFACDTRCEPRRLAGVVLYVRVLPETLSISHLAVHPEYAFGGDLGGGGLGLLLIEKVREIARRINGVKKIQLPYKQGCFLPV